MSWIDGPFVGFDLETTGTDVENARIVTACVVVTAPGQRPSARTWIADAGVEIPVEAALVHGYTTQRVRAEGVPSSIVIRELLDELSEAMQRRLPVVAFNARFDFTVLDREARRHGLPPLTPSSVLDPRVLDKQHDRYRRGRRTLDTVCDYYGVPMTCSHDAEADALAAANLARVIARRYRLGRFELDALHALQVRWAAEQAASLEQHFMRQGKPEHVHREWPLVAPLSAVRLRRRAGR